MESKELETVFTSFALQDEGGTPEEFQQHGRDFSIGQYEGQLQICGLDLHFKDIQNQNKACSKGASAFLYDTVEVEGRLFGILLTCGHAIIKPHLKFHLGLATFKLDTTIEICCPLKQVFVLEELRKVQQTDLKTLNLDQKINYGKQLASTDYAFATIDFSDELCRLKKYYQKIMNLLSIKKWRIGIDYDPMAIYYDKAQNFQNQERNILIVCPTKGGVPEQQRDCHQTYSGFALDPKQSKNTGITHMEKEIMIYNVPTVRGHSGAVVGFEILDEEKKVTFRPIGIHLGKTPVPQQTENIGRIITPDIQKRGQKVCDFIMRLGRYSTAELGIITFENMDDVIAKYTNLKEDTMPSE